jgi:hypothetical protein
LHLAVTASRIFVVNSKNASLVAVRMSATRLLQIVACSIKIGERGQGFSKWMHQATLHAAEA